MAAGFSGNVYICPPGIVTCLVQGMYFCMWGTSLLVITFADYNSILTITAPTTGLGLVRPKARAAKSKALCMYCSSGVLVTNIFTSYQKTLVRFTYVSLHPKGTPPFGARNFGHDRREHQECRNGQ